MLGSIQPGRLSEYVSSAIHGGSGDDGLLQRFGMMVFPVIGSRWKNVDREPNSAAADAAFDVFERIALLNPNPSETVTMVFDSDAQDLFEEWREGFENRLRKDLPPAIESHLSKYRKLVPAISLVCAMADQEDKVSVTSLARALEWSEYLEAHAHKVYGIGRSPVEGARALLQKIKDYSITNGFSARDVQRKGWSHLSDKESVKNAIETLEEFAYLKEVVSETEGRYKASYLINPKVFA